MWLQLSGFPLTWKVRENLENISCQGKSGNFFYFSKKSGNIFLNAACHENKHIVILL